MGNLAACRSIVAIVILPATCDNNVIEDGDFASAASHVIAVPVVAVGDE